jgi:hypothetical protein
MARLIIGVLIGLVLGGVLTFFLFVGTPRSAKVPGVPIKPPDANGVPAGTAEVVLREDFFNNVLGTIFQQMNAPVFPLGGNSQQPVAANDQQGCPSRITVLQQGSGVQTGVRFENNNLEAPLAFNGSYESPVGCLQFSGWAQARMDLRFDQATQSVFGQLTVETVNLDGINPFLSGLVTPIVQSSLNARVNPVKILDGRQLAVKMPIAAANGNLQAGVNDVRAEVKDNALNLFVNYDFHGAPLQPQN